MNQAVMLGGLAVAERLGVARDEALRYQRREDRRACGFPEPDGRIGRAPWWWSTTVDAWLDREPGRHHVSERAAAQSR
jgi:hypothetical protein